MFSKNALDTKLAQHLINAGACYKQDLMLIGSQYATERHVRNMIKARTEQGYFTSFEVAKKKRYKVDDSYEAIALTKKGKVAYLDTINEDRKFYNNFSLEKEKLFRTTSPDALRSTLELSRVEIMFSLAGVRTYPVEKPSLYHLYVSLIDNMLDYKEEYDNSPHYRDDFSPDQCEELLKDGIFYTIKEVRDFLEQLSDTGSDDTYRSRARGVFISKDKILVVYTSNVGANKLIRISNTGEKRLISKLKVFSKITNAYRKLPALSKKRKSEYGDQLIVDNMAEGYPYGLVVSDNDSLVYSMAVGNPNGIIKNGDLMTLESVRKKYKEDKGDNDIMGWLKADETIFPRLFVTPFTKYGIGSLQYLTHTSAEEWLEASRSLFASSSNFELDQYDPIYPAYEKGDWSYKSIFIPVFEVNELNTIANSKYTPTILTYPDMLNAIAHSIRKQPRYYNADYMSQIDQDKVLIYDQYGHPMGYHILELALQKENLTCTKKELNSLPALNGYTFIKFYNEIARGNIDVKSLIPTLDTEEVEEKQSKRLRRKSLTLTMSEEFINKIKKAAKLHDMSQSAYVKNLIYNKVIEDSEAYNEKLKQAKINWNANKL